MSLRYAQWLVYETPAGFKLSRSLEFGLCHALDELTTIVSMSGGHGDGTWFCETWRPDR